MRRSSHERIVASSTVQRARLVSAGALLVVSLLLGARAALAQVEIIRGPYLQNVQTDGITIMWEQSEPGAPTIRITSDDANFQVPTVVPAFRHEVAIGGLEPNRIYTYQLFDGTTPLSEPLELPTAVESGQPFRFITFGDSRSRHDAHARVIEAMNREENVRFYVQTGDLVNDGEVFEQWETYFEIEHPMMSRMPLYPVIGNHDVYELAADHFVELFSLPENSPGPEEYYSFDYGNVHFVILDGHTDNTLNWAECIATRERYYDDCFTEEQESWLLEDLRAAAVAPHIDHIVVSIHIGPYSSKAGRSGNAQIRDLLPFFRAMGVSFIVSGHDHYYEHGVSGNGIQYVITGGGGAPLYAISTPNAAPHQVIYNEMIENYLVIDVDGPVMSIVAKEPGGRILDEFTIDTTPECDSHVDCEDRRIPWACEGYWVCSIGSRCVYECGTRPEPEAPPEPIYAPWTPPPGFDPNEQAPPPPVQTDWFARFHDERGRRRPAILTARIARPPYPWLTTAPMSRGPDVATGTDGTARGEPLRRVQRRPDDGSCSSSGTTHGAGGLLLLALGVRQSRTRRPRREAAA